MEAALRKLISIGSDRIVRLLWNSDYLRDWGRLGAELESVLEVKNGFYAYESALLIRPLRKESDPLGIEEWNRQELWRAKYIDKLDDVLFFAEDIFGVQFCIRGESICTFDPETAAIEEMSLSLSEWAETILSDYEMQTGYPMAHAWQAVNGPLAPGERLIPKVPFIREGKFEVDNLYVLSDVEGMSFRATISNGIKGVQDGERIRFRIVP